MIACPTCGDEDPERTRFCVDSGTPLVIGATDEERKLVTIVFTELPSGSEPFTEDPEELRDLLQAEGPRVRIERAPEPNARQLRLSVGSAEAIVAEVDALLQDVAAA